MTDQNDQSRQVVRVFLDANVLFAAAVGGGSVQLWGIAEIQLVTSLFAAEEAHVNLGNMDGGLALQERLGELLAGIEVHDICIDPTLFASFKLKDPNDIPILHGAIETGCAYLCTADKACFGEFYGSKLGGVEVIKPGKLLALFDR